MEARCLVASAEPFSCALQPDLPAYERWELIVDYTEALLVDLGPSLLVLYASLAGPPITRDALAALVQPVVQVQVESASREEVLRQVREGYAPVLARARQRVEALG